jgi:hypothetical protein
MARPGPDDDVSDGLGRNAELRCSILTREGVAANKLLGDVELTTELADLVFEEFAQRLDELQAVTGHETLGDTTNVMVSLDGLRRTLEGDALNDIWKKEVSV